MKEGRAFCKSVLFNIKRTQIFVPGLRHIGTTGEIYCQTDKKQSGEQTLM
jgi:hypothetical protein